MSKPKSPKGFRCWDEIQPLLPEHLRDTTEQKACQLSRAVPARFAQYIRINGQKSTAYWAESDVVAWAKVHWGVLFPDCVQSFLDAGFEEASSVESNTPRPKKKGCNPKIKKHMRMKRDDT